MPSPRPPHPDWADSERPRPKPEEARPRRRKTIVREHITEPIGEVIDRLRGQQPDRPRAADDAETYTALTELRDWLIGRKRRKPVQHVTEGRRYLGPDGQDIEEE